MASPTPATSGWGYSRANTEEEFAQRYLELLKVVRSLPVLAGFCYTQFADTYQETNGLVYADRTPKTALEAIALATRGPRTQHDHQMECEFRERLITTSAINMSFPKRTTTRP